MLFNNKRGFLRILEAFIAVLIIASVMSFLYVKQIKQPSEERQVQQIMKVALDEISNNRLLREAVLNSDNQTINSSLSEIIPNIYVFEFRICELNQICGLEKQNSYYTENNIFADEATISSTLETYGLKKIRIFIWEK